VLELIPEGKEHKHASGKIIGTTFEMAWSWAARNVYQNLQQRKVWNREMRSCSAEVWEVFPAICKLHLNGATLLHVHTPLAVSIT